MKSNCRIIVVFIAKIPPLVNSRHIHPISFSICCLSAIFCFIDQLLQILQLARKLDTKSLHVTHVAIVRIKSDTPFLCKTRIHAISSPCLPTERGPLIPPRRICCLSVFVDLDANLVQQPPACLPSCVPLAAFDIRPDPTRPDRCSQPRDTIPTASQGEGHERGPLTRPWFV